MSECRGGGRGQRARARGSTADTGLARRRRQPACQPRASTPHVNVTAAARRSTTGLGSGDQVFQ